MKSISIRTPWGRLHLVAEKNGAAHLAGLKFGTKVRALHVTAEARAHFHKRLGLPFEALDPEDLRKLPDFRDLERAHLVNDYDLGSGLVTNVGAMSLANDPFWSSTLNISTLKLANNHASGTGVTLAAATDFKLQTPSTVGGQTPVAGTQSIDTSSTMAVPKYKTVATISYSNTEAVTEWGLFSTGTLSTTTGTPFTAATATTFTATGTPFTASSATVQGLQGQIVVPGTTTVLGLIASNTTSVGTLVNNGTTGWWTQAAQTAGSTPGGTEAYTLRPVMWDHKVFAAVNVGTGDAIQFTYLLTVTSGG